MPAYGDKSLDRRTEFETIEVVLLENTTGMNFGLSSSIARPGGVSEKTDRES